ncbi:MAG: efflux RND transporter periplasmic adaptor subunit, partial [Chthonomonadaceae bacterium]|nr:efflux RND transporter periplasmic adaptor subunit [Chthonomonadaceae bacterium]
NELEVTNARSQIASARSQVRQQEATLLQAQTSVLPETKRRELENARAAYAQARAQLRGADAGITQDAMRGDEAVASLAGVEQLQKQLDELLVRQNDTTIIASMDGVITKKYTEEGELITSAIGSFSSGSPLYQISDLSTMLVKINVNEVDIQKMKVGTITEVTVDSSRGTIFMGKVSKVAPAASNATASSGSAATTSSQTVIRFPVEIQVDKSDPRLKPGMSARCAVIVNREKDVVRVPKNCVKGEGKTGTADIVTPTVKPTKDGATETVTVRTVEVGLRGDDFVEVKSGLKEGEKVRPAAFNGPKRQTIEMNNGPN